MTHRDEGGRTDRRSPAPRLRGLGFGVLAAVVVGCSGGADDAGDPAPDLTPHPVVTLEDVPNSGHASVLAGFSRATQELLLNADSLELLGIICEREPDANELALREEYPIRTRKLLERRADRAEVLGALYAGVASPGPLAFCFDPHHALVAKAGERTLEVVICYACAQVQLWEGDESVSVGIGRTGADVLNRWLGQSRSVPLGEIDGRPLAHWLKRVAAGPKSDGYDDACEVVVSALKHTPLKPEDLTQVLVSLRARLRFEHSGMISVLDEALRETEPEANLLGLIGLVADLAANPGEDEEKRDNLSTLAQSLFDNLQESPPGPDAVIASVGPPNTPTVRSATTKALAAFTWLEAEVVQEWVDRLADEEDPVLRAELETALAPLRR